jgi:hypothetical protein
VTWRAGRVTELAATATTCRALDEVVKAWVPVRTAEATARNGDLPARSARVGVGSGEDPLRYRRLAALQPKEEAVDLEVVGMSGTVGHIHHIPTVVTGSGVGVIALGRCVNIGPALCCGGKLARDGWRLRLRAWCQLASWYR